jgi:aarF domain-containing kinase
MEYIDGIKIDETEALAEKFGNAKSCSDILLDVFAKMIFVDGHIHCDAHPGNILVRPNPKTNKP